MDPVIYYPKRPMAQCHLWDCERGELPYCSVEHEYVAISDESFDKALVFVDGIDFNVMDLRSQKVLGLKALDEENCCGIPYLEADILNQTPWDTIEFPFILEETETSRVWVFSSDNTRPGEIWRNVGGRRLGEIAISSWALHLDHPAGKFKLRKYSREEVHGAVYWLIFGERLSRSLTRFREVVTMDNASPVSRDNANANIIGLLTQPLCATHLTMNHAQESKTLVNKLSGIVEDLTAKVTAWEEERGKEFLYGGVRVLTMLEQYKTLWEDKELEKQSQGDQKKLHGLVITEQEALYNKSGKNPLTTPVTTAAVNRELSLGALHAAVNRELSLGALHAAHLTMNHAEESQILVNKLSGMVEDKEFLDGDVRVLTMLEQLKTLWEEKELGKQRQRDQKKLHEQVITEQEALSNKSGKNPLTTPVTTAAVNRELSLGALPHQSLKPEKAALSSKRTTYCDENAKNSTLPTPSGKRNSMRRNPLSPLEFESYAASW